MGTISITLPTAGFPNSTEDPKVVTALSTIETVINGNLDDDNIASGANINGSKLNDASIATSKLASGAAAANLGTGSIGTSLIADDAVTVDKLTADFTRDTLGSDFVNLAASGVETAFGGSTRTGTNGISVVVFNLNIELAGSVGANTTLYFNIFSGSNVLYHTVPIRRDPNATSDLFPVSVTTITNASAAWAPNVTVDTGSGVTTVSSGSTIYSWRIS